MLSERSIAVSKDAQRERRLRFYQGNLFALCTDVLGYDKLSESFHKPLLKEWDRIDKARFNGDVIDTLDLWPRDHIKTWCERARIIRYLMVDPTITITWWHAVEEMAKESGEAIGKVLQTNKELRLLLDPSVLPSKMAKKFISGGGFSMPGNRIGDAPSFRAWGAGSEATGGHSRVGVMDDPIGYNDVVDSQMPAKRRWYQATVCNVVSRNLNGWIDAIGTRWDRDDIYSDWLKSKHWDCRIRACMETDGKPDYKGTPVYLSKPQIDKKRDEMGEVMFAFQMMNDETPTGERLWDPTLCEHYIPLAEAKGEGSLVCLSDPAPAKIGSLQDPQAKWRGDGTKNEWAICIVKFRNRGDRREIILLDGDASKQWDLSEGYRNIFAMMRKWKCNRLAEESTGQAIALYESTRRAVAREEGAKYRPVKLEGTYEGRAKKVYFAALVDRAKQDEFLISDSVPSSFLEGFVDQCRNLVFLLDGRRNNLRLDDRVNVVSFATDPGLKYIIPIPEFEEITPFTVLDREPEFDNGTRYVRW